MGGKASRIVAEGFMKGVFDVFDAMLSVEFTHEVEEAQEADAALVQEAVESYPFMMRARIASGGAVALLFTVPDVSTFISLLMGEGISRKDSLNDSDIATLREIAEPCLGSGVTNLMERFGRNVEQPKDVSVGTLESTGVQELLSFIGPPVMAAPFAFSAPEIDTGGMLLFAQQTEKLVPEDMLNDRDLDSGGLAEEAEISEAEMTDILSGFSPEGVSPLSDALAGAAPGPSRPLPENIDRVLDIRLVATARLGRVEMPIGEILALGPGSIIDVGRMVDEPVELLVNDKLIARGDVVVVDEKFGLRITEIVSPEKRIESLR